MIDKLDAVGRGAHRQTVHGGTRRRRRIPLCLGSLTGPGLNPWDRTRWSGGSSSGSAAAVAAGLVPFAIGSRDLGLHRHSRVSYCGVTALRPTYGLVSRYGAMALSWTLDKLGPSRTPREDCGLILQAIAGKDGKDPGIAPARASTTRRNTRAR